MSEIRNNREWGDSICVLITDNMWAAKFLVSRVCFLVVVLILDYVYFNYSWLILIKKISAHMESKLTIMLIEIKWTLKVTDIIH